MPHVETHDGVAVLASGDTILVVYSTHAVLHRTAWLFDRVDDILGEHPGVASWAAMMVVLDTAEPPDAATRDENRRRLRRIGSRVRRLVTVALGDGFRCAIIRGVMRTLAILTGHSKVHLIESSIEGGLRAVDAARSDRTPSMHALERQLAMAFHALSLPSPSSENRGHSPPA